MTTILRNKTITKILSVLIALVLWAYVITVEDPIQEHRIHNVPIEFINVDALEMRDLTLLSADRQTVTVIIRGTARNIAQAEGQITATANVFGRGVGTSSVPVTVVPLGIVDARVLPAHSNVNITVDHLVSMYKPITVDFVGEIAPDTEAGQITMQPEQIEIRGARTLIVSIAHVGVEVPYEQISRDGSTFTLDILVLDEQGYQIENVNLSSDIAIVDLTLYDTREVPIQVELIGEVGDDYVITRLQVPETVRIRGHRSVINNVQSIQTEPIDISDIQITSVIPINPILPYGVQLARGYENINVRIDIAGILTESFEFSLADIEIRNLDSGLIAYISTPSVTLNVTGSEGVISGAERGNFTLFVDVEELELGTHAVEVMLEHDKILIEYELTPQEVHVTININVMAPEEIPEPEYEEQYEYDTDY